MFNKTILLLSLCMMSNIAFAQFELQKDATSAVKKLLTEHYGAKFDKKKQCQIYDFTAYAEYGAEKEPYCVRVVSADFKLLNQIPTLYLAVAGDTVEEASRVDTGLGGLFILQRKEKDWHIIAKNPYIASGGAGRSQMTDYKLIEIGQHKYAWLGEECASGAGGETSCQTNIYAPIAKKIALIAEIESHHSYEFASGDEYLDDNAQINILKNQPVVNGYYPISVKVKTETGKFNRQGQKVKPKIKHHQYKMTFDVKMQQFIEVKEKQ